MSKDASLSRRLLVATFGVGLTAATISGVGVPFLMAQPGKAAPTENENSAFAKEEQMQVKKFNVTVQRFNPSTQTPGEEFVLPVDCPDAEHAASAVLSNLIAWTPKTEGGKILPIAFRCIAINERVG